MVVSVFTIVPFSVSAETEWQVSDPSLESGSGTESDPYRIYSLADLEAFRDRVNKEEHFSGVFFRLMDDITINEPDAFEYDEDGTIIGIRDEESINEWIPIGNTVYTEFCGNFDGNGHSIIGQYVYYNGPNLYYAGFFGYIKYGTVCNLGVVDGYLSVNGGGHVGAVVGSLAAGEISNCYNTCTISSNGPAGGIAGNVRTLSEKDTTITCCYNNGNILGEGYYHGGIIGLCEDSGNYISECYNVGSIFGSERVGGIVGETTRDTYVNSCYNNGDIHGTAWVGGIVGIAGNVSDSFNNGSVSGNTGVGGIAGYINCGYESDCYNAGEIFANNIAGGIAGEISVNGTYKEYVEMSSCYSIGKVNCDGEITGGIVGRLYSTNGTFYAYDAMLIKNCYYLESSASIEIGANEGTRGTRTITNVLSLSADQMKNADSFNGFDFDTIWTMDAPAYEYPALRALLDAYIVAVRKTISVTTPDGAAIVSGYNVKWYEKDSNKMIGKGKTLSITDTEKAYQIEIILGEELSFLYQQPARLDVAMDDASPIINVQLESYSKATVTGKVCDKENHSLSNATVTFKQVFNGNYLKNTVVNTDESGEYTAEIAYVPTEVIISANGYYSRTKSVITNQSFENKIDFGTVSLVKLPENKITLHLTKVNASLPDETGTKEEILSTNSLSFTLYNQTKNKAVTDFIVQYPYIYLENKAADADDSILISITDNNQQMTAEQQTVKLDAQKTASCSIEFTENGKFSISTLNGNESDILMLFDESGKFIYSESVASNHLSRPLLEGNYIAVLMQKTDLLRSVSTIDKLAEFGLSENADYTVKNISVSNGVITDVGTINIPALDESKLYYTVPENTLFTANSLSMPVGKYVIMRCAYEIDSQYSSANETVTIELPDDMDFISGSLTVDGKLVTCAKNGNTIEIHANKKSGIIRFYTVATAKGQKNINASLSFDLGESTVTQPIGTASFTAEAGKIVLPEKTGQTRVTATGTTMANSKVTLYDNGVEVGTGKSNAAGSWKIRFDFNKPYSFSYHDIYAKIESEKIEQEILTDPQIICYDKNYIEVSKVTMINTAHPAGALNTVEFVTVFDFLNPSNTVPSYNYWPNYPTFTFKVEFTGGDNTVLSDVNVVTTDTSGNETYVPVVYDESTDLWIGTHDYTSFSDIPNLVNVVFNGNEEKDNFEPDEEMIQDDLEYYKDQAEQNGFDLSSIYIITARRIDNNKTEVELTPKSDKVPRVKIEHEKKTEQLTPEQADKRKDEYRSKGYSEKTGKNGTTTFSNGGKTVKIPDYNKPDASGDPPQGDDVPKTIPVETEKGEFIIDLDPELPGVQGCGYSLEDWLDLSVDLIGLGSAFIPGLIGQVGGVATGLAGIIKDSYTLRNLRRELARNYDAYVKLINMSNRYLTKKCADGDSALTKEQIQSFSERLKALIRLYDTQRSDLSSYLDRFHFGNLAISCLSTGVGVTASYGEGIALGISDFIFSRGVNSTYNDIDRSIWQMDHFMKGELSKLINEIVKAYKCSVNPDIPFGKPAHPTGYRGTGIADPSGYVYEAVPSNRLEGVKVEAYYYDYATDEFGIPEDNKSDILWDAENYDQVNPLYTDANGQYAWDVPMGQWMVKFSKDGYYDTDSKLLNMVDDEGYLPVPPPQTEVNVGMVSKAAPVVDEVSIYDSEIRIAFSQYMQIDSVNNNTVTVRMNGKNVSGTISPVNAEFDYEKKHQYASVFSFVPNVSMSGNINVTVNGATNYAGTKMAEKYAQSNRVAIKPESITVNDSVSVTYNSGALLEIQVTPAEAGAGLTLEAESSSPSIVGIANSSVVLDENGHGNIMLEGKLPGQGEITVSLKGTDLTKTVTANVAGVVPVNDRCEKVKASIASGSTVEKGTLVELTTDTEDAEIYYTLDGTCPCTLDSPSRLKYTNPIRIDENTFIIAYAVKDGMQESYTAGFNYFVPAPIVEVLLGDVDGDDSVTILDATYIQRHLASIPILFAFNNDIADTDEDGSVTILDATYIQRWLASLPSNKKIGKPITR